MCAGAHIQMRMQACLQNSLCSTFAMRAIKNKNKRLGESKLSKHSCNRNWIDQHERLCLYFKCNERTLCVQRKMIVVCRKFVHAVVCC